MSGTFTIQVRIFAGMGGYWECEILRDNHRRVIRSYKLDSLMIAVNEILEDFRRTYG